MTQSLNPIIRVSLVITGIVQGVGFRPFVYRHAIELGLSGFVLNNSQGVTIEVQGLSSKVNDFIRQFSTPPPLARIDAIKQTQLAKDSHSTQFVIVESHNELDAIVSLSPDKSTCSDCLAEMKDPTNRHYRYPFVNCTNCGPRYSLINALPYDRKHTSMAHFVMCQQCQQSYQNPMDRRYHAQPISCPQCGPVLRFLSHESSVLFDKYQAVEHAVERLKQGDILAIKGLGGFHLVCDASNDDAVCRLRERKKRPSKPLAVMMPNVEMAKTWVTGAEFEWQQLTNIERPIVIMHQSKTPDTKPDAYTALSIDLSPSIAPGIDKLGIFLPYTPLHQLLMDQLQRPLVATSANRSGEPIICNAEEIQRQLPDVFDGILDHDRPILNACDDSVIQCIGKEVQILRLARGYAPFSMPMPRKIPCHILAVGAQQKNSLAFAFANQIVLSPHIGDLFSVEAEQYFNHTLETFERLYRFNPQHICHDLHLGYSPSKWAQQRCKQDSSLTQIPVQHHYAHILSVMATHHYTDKVLGFSFDGTGLGTDASLWGGEAMIADINGFTRICHLKSFSLIGGEQAINDPKRILLALLFQQYSLSEVLAMPISIIDNSDPTLISNLHKIWSSGSACIQTSSMGRLFDAVAILLGLLDRNQYEGQAGMLLEAAANQTSDLPDELHFTLPRVKDQWDTTHLIMQLINATTAETLTEQRVGLIAKGFMLCICDAVSQLALIYPWAPVVLSGGVFQNRFLSEACHSQLKKQKSIRLDSQKLPINDGGIALGQLWFGLHKINGALSKAPQESINT
ncbi:carbamoyltransferase HypF [Shewanella sp. NR704-98]|uniref:Carbamoyltransferase HypF n=2 Tax=Shewanella nanhaiensis TaxID=2864872 RepID=A0ABS7E5H2_9GAMM|nr:carbamoyltransferase HypF [Shewanella nanhaiensis]MBW8184931.1 carbamoyltransferase HypF [Shewanella nanhaiensis]